jgi:predicted DNA-binding transcriptional regulator AlpA
MNETAPVALAHGLAPQRHHIDRRADAIAAGFTGADDQLIDTKQLANWLGVSTQFLEIGRSRGYGPKFCRLSPRRCRYRVGDVRTWLAERTHAATAEYSRSAERTLGMIDTQPPEPTPRIRRRRAA